VRLIIEKDLLDTEKCDGVVFFHRCGENYRYKQREYNKLIRKDRCTIVQCPYRGLNKDYNTT
jgi:hypothetical protein